MLPEALEDEGGEGETPSDGLESQIQIFEDGEWQQVVRP